MPPPSFKHLCTVTAAAWGLLALALLLWPALLHLLFSIPSDSSADIMSRRLGVLFTGLATILWTARTEEDSVLRRGLCLGCCVAMGGMACLGVVEFGRGAVGAGIWLAIVVELGFAALFLKFTRETA